MLFGFHRCVFVCVAFAAIAPARAAAQQAAPDGDQALATEARLEDLVRIAIARNPDLGEARARMAAATARARQAARLPELQLKYEQWGVPLTRPWDLGMADAVMVGFNQTFPALRTSKARAAVAETEAEMTALGERTRRRELAAQVRRAFAEYYRTDRQLRLHREHVDITSRLVDLARGAYRSGATSQQDVLRLTLELSRIHGQLARMEPERRAARGLLNALMNRALEAPLGAPAELSPDIRSADRSEGPRRSEEAAAEKAIARAESTAALARANASWPSVMVGVDYMYMPMNPHAHGYGAMVAINVPWLSPGRRDEIRAAEQTALAERRALESTRSAIGFQILEAEARLDAAKAAFEVIDRDVVTQAQRNFEAARASYAVGRADALSLLDALRSFLDVRLERVGALAQLEAARADLANAVGDEVLR